MGVLKPCVDPKEKIKLGEGIFFSCCIPELFSQDLRSVNCSFPSMWFIISNQSLPCLSSWNLGHFLGPSLPGKSLGLETSTRKVGRALREGLTVLRKEFLLWNKILQTWLNSEYSTVVNAKSKVVCLGFFNLFFYSRIFYY